MAAPTARGFATLVVDGEEERAAFAGSRAGPTRSRARRAAYRTPYGREALEAPSARDEDSLLGRFKSIFSWLVPAAWLAPSEAAPRTERGGAAPCEEGGRQVAAKYASCGGALLPSEATRGPLEGAKGPSPVGKHYAIGAACGGDADAILWQLKDAAQRQASTHRHIYEGLAAFFRVRGPQAAWLTAAEHATLAAIIMAQVEEGGAPCDGAFGDDTPEGGHNWEAPASIRSLPPKGPMTPGVRSLLAAPPSVASLGRPAALHAMRSNYSMGRGGQRQRSVEAAQGRMGGALEMPLRAPYGEEVVRGRTVAEAEARSSRCTYSARFEEYEGEAALDDAILLASASRRPFTRRASSASRSRLIQEARQRVASQIQQAIGQEASEKGAISKETVGKEAASKETTISKEAISKESEIDAGRHVQFRAPLVAPPATASVGAAQAGSARTGDEEVKPFSFTIQPASLSLQSPPIVERPPQEAPKAAAFSFAKGSDALPSGPPAGSTGGVVVAKPAPFSFGRIEPAAGILGIGSGGEGTNAAKPSGFTFGASAPKPAFESLPSGSLPVTQSAFSFGAPQSFTGKDTAFASGGNASPIQDGASKDGASKDGGMSPSIASSLFHPAVAKEAAPQAKAEERGGEKVAATPFSFGATSSFGAKSSLGATGSSGASSQPSAFGVAKPAPDAKPAFSFGSSVSPLSAFGATAAAAPAETEAKAPSFGGSLPSASPAGRSPFSFGVALPAATSVVGGRPAEAAGARADGPKVAFSFGAAAPIEKAQAGSPFTFGTAVRDSQPAFGAGTAAAAPLAGPTPFAFGSSGSAGGKFTFGAPPQSDPPRAPAFGQSSQPLGGGATFSFGATAPSLAAAAAAAATTAGDGGSKRSSEEGGMDDGAMGQGSGDGKRSGAAVALSSGQAGFSFGAAAGGSAFSAGQGPSPGAPFTFGSAGQQAAPFSFGAPQQAPAPFAFGGGFGASAAAAPFAPAGGDGAAQGDGGGGFSMGKSGAAAPQGSLAGRKISAPMLRRRR